MSVRLSNLLRHGASQRHVHNAMPCAAAYGCPAAEDFAKVLSQVQTGRSYRHSSDPGAAEKKTRVAWCLGEALGDELEVVKAHLRDTMEEIKSLKMALDSQDSMKRMHEEFRSLKAELESKEKRAFLSLTSAAATANQQIVVWNETRGLVSPSYFNVHAKARKITIKQPGVYQIHCRLGQINTANGQHLGILIDGIEVAQCLQSDGNGYQNTAQITEVLEIKAGATLTVRCGANGNLMGQQGQNRLNIVLLEAR